MVQPPATATLVPRRGRGRPPKHGATHTELVSGVVGANGDELLPTPTFTSSLQFKVRGALARPRSQSPSSQSSSTTKDVTAAASTTQVDTSVTPSSTPANGAGTRMRSQRKSKIDAMAAITARSESPSEKVSQPSTSVNGTNSSTPRISPAEKRRASMPESVPLDMSSVKRPDRTIHPPRGAPRPFDLEECPVYYPTAEEFKDPMKYIRSISDHAKQYGICKVIPPEGWNMSFVTDTKTFRFKTRLMRLNSIEASSRAKLNFLEQLYRFHQQQGPPGPVIPTINHKQLDLWLLRKEVHRKGGYDDVTTSRQWGDISRALGYEQVTGVSSQLKNAYTRIILPFEQFSQHIRNSPAMAASLSPATPRLPKPVRMSGFNSVSRMGRAGSRMSGSVGPVSQSPSKRRMSTPLSSSSSALSEPPEDMEVKPIITPDIKIEVSAPPDLRVDASTSSHTPSPQPNATLLPTLGPPEKPPHYVQGDTCEVCNDSDRGTEMLLCDGCDNGYHIFCLDPPLSAIPKGQWYCHICLFDTGGDYGFDEGEEHSLSSMQARDLAFRESWFESHPPLPSNWINPRRNKLGSVEVSEDDVEQEFWRLVQSPLDTVEVEYGADVHSTTHGSASPSLETHPLDPYSKDPWNMHNLPIVQDSLLRYVKSDISGMTVPWTYVGMMFSTFCWHNEDHYTYSVNFMHWGETKTWYGIPGDDAAKFEAAIKSEAPDLFDAQPDLLFQLVTLMSPARLRKAGVRVYACNQRAGEYVITFPQAYHAGFNHGFNLNEAVNFATPDWLEYGRLCVRRYQEHQKLPVFSHEELLITITQHSQTIKTAQWLLPALQEMVQRELNQRRDIRESIPQLREILDEHDREEEEQYQCAVCKGFCYLAQVTCDCTKQVTCLEHWLSLCGCAPSSRTVKHRFSDDQLKSILDGVREKADRPLGWQKEFRHTLMESPKPRLSRLRKLLIEAEQISLPMEEYLCLKDFVASGNEWEARSLAILAPRPLPTFQKHVPRPHSSQPTKPISPEPITHDIEALDECLEEGERLGLKSEAAEELAQAKTWVEQWSKRAKKMLGALEAASSTTPIDAPSWEKLFEEAHTHSINLPLLPEVTKVIQRIRFIEDLKGIEDMSMTLDQIRELKRLATVLGLPQEQEQAMQLAQKASRGEAWHAHAMKVLEQPIRVLEELDQLALPHPSVPINPTLLATIESIRRRARELERQARTILEPLFGHRTHMEDALRLVNRASKELTIPLMTALSESANNAIDLEKKCDDILHARYNPPKPLFEELRAIRATVQLKLWMFHMPNFVEVDSQLIRHDAWLERLPWYRTPEPAMQGQRIVDDIISHTHAEDDQAPVDPACTCICANPVKVSPERPSDAVQCDHCQAKFHASCIEGSCPFCDHHHWNGAIVKARNFQYHELLPIARTAPELTRNYSLAWKHLDIIITNCDRLTRSIDAFLAVVSEPTGQIPYPVALAQIRHYLRKLYKIQFSIKARPELPAYGLTLAHLHRTLATSRSPTDPNSSNGSNGGAPKRRINRRPKFVFRVESAPVASDGTRCLCTGVHAGQWTVTCPACSQKYHNVCVAYDEPTVPSQKPWRCPLCLIRKGKVYPHTALRVRYCDDTEPDMFVDHKTCLETYSGKLIRQRLPPPTEPTIIIELERFIPGSNHNPDGPPPDAPASPPKPPRAGVRTRQSTNGSAQSETSTTSAGASGDTTAVPPPPSTTSSATPEASTKSSQDASAPSTSGNKRKADEPSQPDVNRRRVKLVFRNDPSAES